MVLTKSMIPPIIKSGKAITINPEIASTIRIPGKSIIVKTNFNIPHVALKDRLISLPTNPSNKSENISVIICVSSFLCGYVY